MRHLIAGSIAVAVIVNAVAQIQPGDYIFSTLAGRAGTSGSTDGAGANARFNRPWGVAVDSAGNVYVTEATNHIVRRITADGTVTTLAGQAGVPGFADGVGTAVKFGNETTIFGQTQPGTTNPTGPFGVAVLPSGVAIVADASRHIMRQVTAGGAVSTYAGAPGTFGSTDGASGAALFYFPLNVAIDSAGNAFVADTQNHTIRRISTNGTVTTIAGVIGFWGDSDGIGAAARFLCPSAIAVSPAGNVYVADCANTVRKIMRVPGEDNWQVTTLAGKTLTFGSTDGTGAAARFGGSPSFANNTVSVSYFTTYPPVGFLNTFVSQSYNYADLAGLAVDAAENVYVADSANNIIRKITPGGVVTTIAGATTAGSTDATGTAARFNRPTGIAIDGAGNLYIADFSNHTIRKGTRTAAPAIQAQPSDQTVALGSTVTLTVSVTGSPTPTFQWTRNNVVVPGATGSALTLTNVQVAQAGTYSVTVTNVLGASSTKAFVLNVTGAPVFTVQPAGQTVNGGDTIRLTASTTGAPAPTYQWYRDGQALNGATDSTLTVANAQSGSAGDYTVVATNSLGSVTSNVARVAVNVGRIINLSIRSSLAGSEPLIVGFVAAGGSKSMLIRAVGPALRDFGVSTAMADPQLSLFTGATVTGSNDNWGSAAAAQLSAAAVQVGAFALPANSLDAAILTDVSDAVTAQASAKNGAGGIVLVELYDAASSSPARLINVSARTRVGTGENALFAGFVISGSAPKTVLVRAVGPSLTAFGVTGALADPFLEIFAQGSTTARVSNDNWAGATALVTAFTSVGAFPLPLAASRDAALVTTLPPGAYSARVSGVGNTAGEALLEIYEVP